MRVGPETNQETGGPVSQLTLTLVPTCNQLLGNGCLYVVQGLLSEGSQGLK